MPSTTPTLSTVFFDLDGTLTDPKDGITRCIQYALERMGAYIPEADTLLWCIGPPLRASFATLLATDDQDQIEEAVRLYRVRFADVGLFENSVFPGIPEALERVRTLGLAAVVATSKPCVYAQRIVDHFHLGGLLDQVYGCELDGTLGDKTSLIGHILNDRHLTPEQTLMVGDRKHDVLGALANGLSALGVTYGYGTEAELTQAGAKWLAHTPKDVAVIVEQNLPSR